MCGRVFLHMQGPEPGESVDLELQVAVSCLHGCWELNSLNSSASAASALNHRAIFPFPTQISEQPWNCQILPMFSLLWDIIHQSSYKSRILYAISFSKSLYKEDKKHGFNIRSIPRVKLIAEMIKSLLKICSIIGGEKEEKWWVFTWLTAFPNRSVAIIKQ